MKHLLTLILSIITFSSFSQSIDFKWSAPSTVSLPEGDYFVLTLESAEYTSGNYYLPQVSKTVNGNKIEPKATP